MTTFQAEGARRSRGASVVGAASALLHLDLLLVDEREHLEAVCHLKSAGLEVHWCPSGTDALVLYGRAAPQVVIIAAALPDLPPAQVICAMRRHGTPTILVGVQPGEEEGMGSALMAGASSVVSRPYDGAEIVGQLARIDLAPSPGSRLGFGPLQLDDRAHTVHCDGVELEPLPLKEFDLLRCLLRHADRVVSLAQIKVSVWPDSEQEPSDNTIGVHVHRLRRRLPHPLTVRTVRGLGYRLTLDANGPQPGR